MSNEKQEFPEILEDNTTQDTQAASQKDPKFKFGENLDFASKEAYNLLRTNLAFSFPNYGDRCRIVGVTSPSPQEGKSYTSINLCYSLAKDGMKVLLIDADMRKPSIAQKLDMKLAPGLSNRLIQDDLEGVIHEGILHPNLSIMTAGSIPPTPSELIGSEAMDRLLKELSKTYQYIVVDLPPVLMVADPLIISKYLDGVIIVLRHRQTRHSDIKETVRQLKFVQAKIFGFVYNEYSSERGGYYSYYRKNNYGYYYGTPDKSDKKSAKAEKKTKK